MLILRKLERRQVCLIINSMLAGQNNRGKDDRLSLPYPSVNGAESKKNIIIRIQRRALIMFSEELVRMHYSYKRLSVHNREDLRKLERWFDKELRYVENRN